MATFRRCTWVAVLAVGFVLLGISQTAQAQVVWSGATDDVLLGTNWVGGVVPATSPVAVQEARFTTVGSHTPNLSANWAVRYLGFEDATGAPYTLSGDAATTLTIGTTGTSGLSGNIDTYLNTGDVTINVPNMVMFRASEIYAASTPPGSGNLIINSTSLKMGQGTGTGAAVNIRAIGGNVTIAPTIDFSGQNTRDRTLTLIPSAGRTITLNGGIADAQRAFRINDTGFTGGTVILGNSGTWGSAVTTVANGGVVIINNSNFEINHNTSLGTPGSFTTAYSVVTSGPGNTATGDATGALVLTNNLTGVAELLFLGSRTTFANPQVKSKSGDNTFSGILQTDDVAAGTQHNYALQSDGTAGGDIFRISGPIQTSLAVDLGGASNLSFQGAGPGSVTGDIIEQNSNIWNVEKNGGGTWTLSGATIAYTGTTTVNQGTLAISGSGWTPNSAAITVKNLATLDLSALTGGTLTLGASQALKGAGTVIGNVVAGSGNSIAPGDSAGTLHITGDLTLNGGETLQYELSSNPLGTNDKIVATGTLSAAGPTTVNVTAPSGYLGSGSYRLIDYTGAAIVDPNTVFTQSGFSPSPRQTTSFSSVANQVNFDVVGNAGNLTWVGGLNSNAWDINTTVNWTGEANSHFLDGDRVTFSSSGSNSPDINIVGTVSPASATFTNAPGHDYTLIGGTVAVAGDLTTSGSGNATFSNANVTVTGNFNATGSGNVNFNNVDLTVSSAFSLNGTGKVTIANTGALALPATIAVNGGTLALNRGDDITVTNAFTGAGTLRKENTNTVIANGNNSGFTGPISVAAGTLRTIGNNALGTAAGGVTVENGATLDIWDNGANVPGLGTKVVAITGTGVGGVGALVSTQASSATSAHVHQIILTADSKIAAIGVADRSILWVDGPGASIQGNGKNLSVVVDNGNNPVVGTEIDWLNVGDTNLNNIDVSGGGVLYLGGNTTLGPTSGTLTLQNNGRLGIYASLSGADASTGLIDKPITVDNTTNGGGIEVYHGVKTIDSPIAMNGNLDVAVNNGTSNTTSTATLTGKLTGPGALSVHLVANTTASRMGLVELTNDGNDYAGTTTIGGGGGLNAVIATNDRVSLSIGNGGTTGSIGTGDITLTGAASRALLIFNREGAYTLPNNIITVGTANNARLNAVHASGDVTLSGIVSGTGAILVDAGKMTLSGQNTYSGVTNISGSSQVVISHSDALGTAGDASNGYTFPVGGAGTTSSLVLTNGVATGEYIWMGPRDTLAAQVTSKSGDNTLSGTVQADLLAGFHAYALQSDGTAGGDMFRITGTIQTPSAADIPAGLGGVSQLSLQGDGNGVVSGTIIEQNANVFNVDKNGGGTWTLSGANTYTGTTTVNAGTLLVNGTHATGAGYFVVGGTLGGTGTITTAGGVVVLNSGTLAPGASVGTLSVVGNVSIDGTLGIEVSGTSIDLLAVTGGLTLGAASVLDIQGNLATAVTHVIASYDPGSLVGTFTDALDATSNGYNVVYDNNQIILDELDGDANHDGIVNIFDINLVSSNWNPAGPVGAFAPGNINHDTVVNIFDINQISSNWANVATNGGPAHAQAVPEPSSIALLSLGLLGLAMFARRCRK